MEEGWSDRRRAVELLGSGFYLTEPRSVSLPVCLSAAAAAAAADLVTSSLYPSVCSGSELTVTCFGEESDGAEQV